jgi:predicted thioesterase
VKHTTPMAKPSEHRFRTELLQAGKTATGIEVPAKIVDALASGKKPAVRVTINGYTYRSTVAVMGGKYMVGVRAEVREAAGVAGGEMVDIQIELDDAPREVEVPKALAVAFGRNARAKAAFAQLSNSKKQAFTIPIERAKTEETRDRNVAKAIDALNALGK